MGVPSPFDRAAVTVVNNAGTDVLVEILSHNCYKCAYQLFANLTSGTNATNIGVDTRHGSDFSVYLNTITPPPPPGKRPEYVFSQSFGDRGQYVMEITAKAAAVTTTVQPVSTTVPIVVALAIVAVMFILGHVAKWGWERYLRSRAKDSSDDLSMKTGKQRVMGLDTFRGLCIVVMIFVNYGGGGYWFLNHSAWYGLTVADLVFPWFIWIMGVSMPIAFSSAQRRGATRGKQFYMVAVRSLKLIGLGLLINHPFDLSVMRFPGVLQRFGISYFFVGVIILFVPRFGGGDGVGGSDSFSENAQLLSPFSDQVNLEPRTPRFSARRLLKDIVPHIWEWFIVLCILALWLILTFAVPVPGCPTGYIGPGGLGDYGQYPSCTGGFAKYLDVKVFGLSHIYGHPTCSVPEYYDCGAYDPEGLLGCLTSIVLCYFGVQAGRIILNYPGVGERLVRWVVWGIILGSVGTGLAGGTKFTGAIPICKNLWSLTFILVMGGTGFCMLALMNFIVDIKQWWQGYPFLMVGMNSIVIYFGSEILGEYFPFNFKVAAHHGIQLFANVFGVTCWVVVAWRMYASKVFINV